jgi:hypothetical protein
MTHVCVGCGRVFTGPPHHERCEHCHRARRRLADYRRGFLDGTAAAGLDPDEAREALERAVAAAHVLATAGGAR